jgi:hypothetical protein
MGLGAHIVPCDRLNWIDRSNNDLPRYIPPRRFQYDKTRKTLPDGVVMSWQRNTICLNISKKKNIEFDSAPETAEYFNIYQHYNDALPNYFIDRVGDIWIILRGDISEEKCAWFDDLETLFDNAVNNLSTRQRNDVKYLLLRTRILRR